MVGDGAGNTSTMRVVVILIVIAIIASKFYNAWLSKMPITWTTQDLELASVAVGGKLVQNTQEK